MPEMQVPVGASLESSQRMPEMQEKTGQRKSYKDIKRLLYERDKGRCGICRRRVIFARTTIDHILPRTFNGNHDIDNLRVAHLHCNIARSNKGEAQLRMSITGLRMASSNFSGKQINLRVTPQDYAILKAKAEAQKMSLAAYIIRKALNGTQKGAKES